MQVHIYMPIRLRLRRSLTEFINIIKDKMKNKSSHENAILNLQRKLAKVTKDRDELKHDYFLIVESQ